MRGARCPVKHDKMGISGNYYLYRFLFAQITGERFLIRPRFVIGNRELKLVMVQFFPCRNHLSRSDNFLQLRQSSKIESNQQSTFFSSKPSILGYENYGAKPLEVKLCLMARPEGWFKLAGQHSLVHIAQCLRSFYSLEGLEGNDSC